MEMMFREKYSLALPEELFQTRRRPRSGRRCWMTGWLQSMVLIRRKGRPASPGISAGKENRTRTEMMSDDQTPPFLTSWTASAVTKSEHDWLELRCFQYDREKEKILFQGAMELEKPQEIGHVMRIASQRTAMIPFWWRGRRGRAWKISVMESIECSSDAARPFLNAEHLGPPPPVAEWSLCNGHYVRNIKLGDPFVEEDPTPPAGRR